jgi:hypothetical protein
MILVLLLLKVFAYRFNDSYVLDFKQSLGRAGAEFELSRHPKICQSALSAGRAIHRWISKIM